MCRLTSAQKSAQQLPSKIEALQSESNEAETKFDHQQVHVCVCACVYVCVLACMCAFVYLLTCVHMYVSSSVFACPHASVVKSTKNSKLRQKR